MTARQSKAKTRLPLCRRSNKRGLRKALCKLRAGLASPFCLAVKERRLGVGLAGPWPFDTSTALGIKFVNRGSWIGEGKNRGIGFGGVSIYNFLLTIYYFF